MWSGTETNDNSTQDPYEYYVDTKLQTPFCLILGGFYSDDVGFVSTSCKKCPNGSFVAFDKAPGTQTSDCKSCPLGKEQPNTFTNPVLNLNAYSELCR